MAGKFLIHFVEMFDVYYDPRYVLMNQHMLLHLEKSVRDHGPLWSSSLFVFEDWNGDLSNYFHGTQNIAIQIMTAVTSQQSFPEMIKEIPPGHAKDLVLRLRGQTNRTNRMHLKNEFFAIGALKKGTPGAPFEEDLLLCLGVESIECVTFFKRLQFGDAIFHSQIYKRVSRRNNFTIAYCQGGHTSYGQIEVFFLVEETFRMTCGAVIAPMPKSSGVLCERHEVLGNVVNHIVPLHQPKKNRFDIIPLEDIIDVCLYIKFSDSEVGYAAHFPNHFEKD